MTARRHGFTLLEVLIAMAIFVLMAIVLGGAYINVLNGYAAVQGVAERNDDVKFARSALLNEPNRETVEKGGDFESADGRKVSWKASIDPTNTPDVFQVSFECEINAPQMKKPEVIKETFRLLRPTWSKPEERSKLITQDKERIMKILKGGP